MQPVVFPQEGNPLWPLPTDYGQLDKEGQRLARVNACSLRGTPELEVASWHFFRENYLRPCGFWYKGETFVESPDAHYQWVYDWNKYGMLVHLAPRGGCKSTVNLEDILKKLVTRNYWECALFLATHKFVGLRLGDLMQQIENNQFIINDFGKLKSKKGSGFWNRGSCMELTNGSKVHGFPLKGAALGTRPSGLIVLDDVEKSDDTVLVPSDLREGMEDFFFNALLPMARNPAFRVPVRIIGTIYSRRMFIHWLYSKNDPRVTKYFHRTLMTVHDMSTKDFMNEEWIEEEKERLGPASFSAQCLNEPTTKHERVLDIHPELCTYWLEKGDDETTSNDPLNSQATVVTHTLRGFKDSEADERIPIPHICHRQWGDIVRGMRRFITVDSARTTSPTSDFSVVHVLGFENTHKHRDTLYSLDMWVGRSRPEEIIRQIYRLAVKWGVTLVGIEAYPLMAEFHERVRDNLPDLYGKGEAISRVIPLKFPTSMSKAMKIMSMEWRFRHFKVKLPIQRRDEPAYKQLFHQIENFTEDMALLEHDDAIDTLAMHGAIGKQHKSAAPDIEKPLDLIEELKAGNTEECGVPLMSGINAGDLTTEALHTLLNRKYDDLEEEHGNSDNWWSDWVPPGFPNY